MTPEIILAGAYAIASTPFVAAGYWVARRRAGRRRNEAERCANCSGPLYAPGAGEGPSLVEGVLHCSPCAERLRTRTRASLLAFGGWTVTAVVAAGAVAFTEGAGLGLVLAGGVVAQTTLYAGGAVSIMRRRNREALRSLEDRGEILPEPRRASALGG